nr:MAG TPA: hypothetical protein [Caudoviricetes sp.]
MTKITTYNRGIIIDGHADTKEECETITLLCDSLAKDKNFKQVAYDKGYAAFERIGHTEELKFWSGENIYVNGTAVNIKVGGENTFAYCASVNTAVYTVTDTNVVWNDGTILQHNSVDVLPTDTIIFTTDAYTTRAATVKKSVDLTTLSGWANLSAGNHTIKIKAKGTGYKDSELSAGVTVSKAASTVTLEAGTYKWIDTPNIDITLDRVDIAFTVSGTSYKAITINQGIKYTSRFTVTAFPTSSGGWADDVYKTITLDTAQTVSAEFYKWAITDGNLVKQAAGYNLTINYSTVPMSTGAAYIKINSDTVSSSNYDYVVQPGTSSTNPTLKNSAGTTLTVPYVVQNVEKVAFMGGLAIYVGGSTNNATPYTLTADTTISPGVYGPTADTPIDEPTI